MCLLKDFSLAVQVRNVNGASDNAISGTIAVPAIHQT
jgi:hypothetical protein